METNGSVKDVNYLTVSVVSLNCTLCTTRIDFIMLCQCALWQRVVFVFCHYVFRLAAKWFCACLTPYSYCRQYLGFNPSTLQQQGTASILVT